MGVYKIGLPQGQKYSEAISDTIMEEMKCAGGDQRYSFLSFFSWYVFHFDGKISFVFRSAPFHSEN